MTIMILPLVALVLLSGAVSRYRLDAHALAAGVAAALAGTLGIPLALPEVTLAIPFGLLLALGGVGIAVAVLGSIYAESRIRRVRP